jgi:HK97 family phage prohead protease
MTAESILTFRASTKPAGNRTFAFVISTGDVDRDRDVIDPRGWRLDEYKRNPIVLLNHRHDMLPVARTLSIAVEGNALKTTAEFPPEGIYELADVTHDLVKAGFLNAASVGLRPDRKEYNAQRDGWDIKEATLLEWSIVNVPANSAARVERAARGVCDLAAMTKWFGPALAAPVAPPSASGRGIVSGTPKLFSASSHVARSHAGNVVAVPKSSGYRPHDIVLTLKDEPRGEPVLRIADTPGDKVEFDPRDLPPVLADLAREAVVAAMPRIERHIEQAVRRARGRVD